MKTWKTLLLLLLLGGPLAASGAFLTLENAELRVTWRARDAAIVQAEWKRDGTRLLPEGAALGAAQVPLEGTVAGQDLVFQGAGGARVVYRLPREGHVVVLAAANVPLDLLGRAGGAGRIFTLTPSRIDAVLRADVGREPFYGFLGARPKTLPPATARLGLDAGGGPEAKPFFAAIWEVSATPVPDAAGYTLPNGAGRLYLGPAQREALAAFGAPYVRVLDFGLFGPLGQGLFWALRLLHAWCGNWGWALVLFSLLLRLALWPFNTKTTLQALRTRDLEPHLKAIQDRHQDKAAAQKDVLAFYQRNGHNPMGGCLGALVQMPVFLALYAMLGNVFELRHAPWLLWLQDLSGKDPYYVLPILLGLGMLAQQALAPPVGDPAQRRMMLFLMPAMMVVMFARLPAGLNLYYLVFNLAGMAQTWWLTRKYRPMPVVP